MYIDERVDGAAVGDGKSRGHKLEPPFAGVGREAFEHLVRHLQGADYFYNVVFDAGGREVVARAGTGGVYRLGPEDLELDRVAVDVGGDVDELMGALVVAPQVARAPIGAGLADDEDGSAVAEGGFGLSRRGAFSVRHGFPYLTLISFRPLAISTKSSFLGSSAMAVVAPESP